MKIVLLKSLSLDEKNDIPFPVFAIVPEINVIELQNLLPWVKIWGEKELIDLPIPEEILFENYEKLFYSQPEIKRLGLDKNKLWNKYSPEVDKIFFSEKSLSDQLSQTINPSEISWKELLFRKLLIRISVWGGDNTGTLLFSEMDNPLSQFYRMSLTKDIFLERDWRFLYDSKSDLLELICPSYKIFLDAVKSAFNHINVSIDEYGVPKEYILKTDKYGSKEIVDLMDFINGPGIYRKKMKRICDVLLNPDNNIELKDLSWLLSKYKDPLERLGAERIRELGYDRYHIDQEILALDLEVIVKNELKKKLKIGEKYPNWYVKELLNNLSKDFGCKKRFNSTYIHKFFATSRCNIVGDDGKKCRGYKILGLLG